MLVSPDLYSETEPMKLSGTGGEQPKKYESKLVPENSQV